MPGATRVMFVLHSTSRTGAPRVAVEFGRWLHANDQGSVAFALVADGPLADECAEIGPVVQLPRDGGWAAPCDVDVVWANSAWSHEYIERLAGPRRPVVSHVHELRRGLIGKSVGLRRHDLVRHVAVSEAVRRVLVHDHGALVKEIDVVPGFVRTWTDPSHELHETARLLMSGLDVPHDCLLVGAVGSVWSYKGPDLFVAMAERVLSVRDDVVFAWLGGDTTSSRFAELASLVDEAGLSSKIVLLGERSDAHELVAAFDVFVLPSREDPFPLAMLEAAATGRPIVAFDSGGAAEFVLPDCGMLVAPEDFDAMAGAVCELLDEPAARLTLGDAARRKVTTAFSAAVVPPRLAEVLADVARRRRRPHD